MASAPLRRCAEPRCNKLVRATRCDDCQRKAKRRVSKPGDPFYSSSRWRKLRAHKLRADPLCADCQERGRIVAATVVDHVLDRRDRPDLAYDLDNLNSLCVPCHNRKTAKTQARRRGRG